MPLHDNDDLYEQLEDLEEIEEELPPIRNLPPRKRMPEHKRHPQHAPKRSREEVVASLADAELTYEFTYRASRHEAVWIKDSLGSFYRQLWFDDILRLIRGGKEASVYLCLGNSTSGAKYVAAKIYRPRMFRSLRKDHVYREGRLVLDSDGTLVKGDRVVRALNKGTDFGKEVAHTSWMEHEFQTMLVLHDAGADIPKPYARGDNCILMEYIGGDVLAAPTLNTIELDATEAKLLFQRCLHNLELMLAHDRVHADFSAYNMLYWEGKITVIDFPQAVQPEQNQSAYAFFQRDVARICEYFAGQGVEADPAKIARDMWTAHHHRTRPEADPAFLDAEDEGDMAYWESGKEEE